MKTEDLLESLLLEHRAACDMRRNICPTEGNVQKARAELRRYRNALKVIARPPYQWDSPESRETDEVRFRCRIAKEAIDATER